jgi:hypothetical protein
MHKGMAPPQGLALSNLRSNMTVSMFFSWAKISAAHAPAGPPPTTATLYFMLREEEDAIGDLVTGVTLVKDEGLKADTEAVTAVRARMVNFMLNAIQLTEEVFYETKRRSPSCDGMSVEHQIITVVDPADCKTG